MPGYPSQPTPTPPPNNGPILNPTGSGGTDAGQSGIPGTAPGHLDPKAQLKQWFQTGHYGRIQRFLSNQGYGVKVDHKWGTQTHSAYNAYMRGMGAANWKIFYQRVHGSKPASHSGGGGGSGGSGGAAGSGDFNMPPPPPANGVGLPSISSILGPGAMPYLNPDIYANTIAGAEFDPQIQALGESRKHTAAMIPQIAQALDRAYNPAVASANARAAADQQSAAGVGSGIAGMAAQMAHALGGTGGQELASAGLNQAAGAQAQGAIQAGSDRAAATDLVSQVGQAKARTTNQYQKALQAIDQATVTAKGDKATEVAKRLIEGAQFRQQLLGAALANRGAEVNQDSLAQMSGLQSQAAELANMQAYQNLGVQGQQAMDAHTQNQLAIQKFQTDMAQSGKVRFTQLQPQDLTQLDSYFRSGAVDANGKLAIPAATFKNKIMGVLNSMFPQDANSPAVNRWATAIVQRYS